MAVKDVTTTRGYIGLSSDDKPAAAPDGSTFHCVDTGEQYVFYDGTWEADLRLIYALQYVQG